jgi:hypothetical protein
MKTYWGLGEEISFDLGTSWRSVISFSPQPLYFRRKRPTVPTDRMLGGTKSRSGRRGEQKNLREVGYGNMYWTEVAQDGILWDACMKSVVKTGHS